MSKKSIVRLAGVGHEVPAPASNKKGSKFGHLNKLQIFVTYPTDQKYKKANININLQLSHSSKVFVSQIVIEVYILGQYVSQCMCTQYY